MKENLPIYDLNHAQEVVMLQTTYSLYKRVVNIVMSVTFDEDIDFNLMQNAMQLAFDRNDCTRLFFFKQKGKLKQYFRKPFKIEQIPVCEFKTEEEQNAFINKQTSSAIKYLKGVVIEPTFCKTFNGKCMIFVKVCHLAFDIYGLNIFFNDLLGIYSALKENKELPPAPTNFEDVLKRDLKIYQDENRNKVNADFFNNFLAEHETPIYAGVHGPNTKIAQKAIKKKRIDINMYFVRNTTHGYMLEIPEDAVTDLLNCCQATKKTLSTLLMYIYAVTLSRVNHDIKNTLMLELCNMRTTMLERKCAGDKAQSSLCYTTIDKDKSFTENLQLFAERENMYHRHLGFSDLEAQLLLHKNYKFSPLGILYPLAFSFIPMIQPKGISFDIYSNGKGALPAYCAVLFDPTTNRMNVAYDVQVKLTTKELLEQFHNNMVNVIRQVAKNPQILVKDIEYKEQY